MGQCLESSHWSGIDNVLRNSGGPRQGLGVADSAGMPRGSIGGSRLLSLYLQFVTRPGPHFEKKRRSTDYGALGIVNSTHAKHAVIEPSSIQHCRFFVYEGRVTKSGRVTKYGH